MADYTLSCIKDPNGNTYNIKAKALESPVNIALTGNVTGNVTTDFSGSVSLAATIAANSVTTAKIAEGAVTTSRLASQSVSFDKIDPSAYSGTVSAGDSNLSTHSAVKTYVEQVVSGQGTYRGVQTVATINTWTAANLNNGDRVICADAGTITLGGLVVVAGQECVFYKTSETAVWQTSAGAYKLKQTEKTDPSASGNGLTFIATITQNANGEITATKTNITTATSNNDGLMTSANVTKLTGISTGANKVEASDTNGKIKIDGTDTTVYTHPTYSTASAAAKKIGRDSLGHVVIGDTLAVADISGLSSALAGKQAAGNYKTTQTAVTDPTASETSITFISNISQDTNGVITPLKKTIVSGTTETSGIVMLSNTPSENTGTAATPKLVTNAINALDYTDTPSDHQFITQVNEVNGKLASIRRAQPVIADVDGLQDELDDKEDAFTISYSSSDNSLTFSKSFVVG